jgi:hypothetical protein
MKPDINDDNKFKEGTIVTAKADPSLKLIIMKYKKRIYYCAEEANRSHNNFAYFEAELTTP